MSFQSTIRSIHGYIKLSVEEVALVREHPLTHIFVGVALWADDTPETKTITVPSLFTPDAHVFSLQPFLKPFKHLTFTTYDIYRYYISVLDIKKKKESDLCD